MNDENAIWLETVKPGSTLSAANLLVQFGQEEGHQLEEIL